MGGISTNKWLAYMALSNSATDIWEKFDIDKTIVIDDFETNVVGEVDFIDDTDFSITRKTMEVPIPHTDGCGMILPNAFGKQQVNMMVRLPWIKGLMGVFPFDKFIENNDGSPVIKDIYGNEASSFPCDGRTMFFPVGSYTINITNTKNHYETQLCILDPPVADHSRSRHGSHHRRHHNQLHGLRPTAVRNLEYHT
jgi:hypothetical protein